MKEPEENRFLQKPKRREKKEAEKIIFYYINLYFKGIVSRKKELTTSVDSNNYISDSITCSIEKEDDRQRKRKRKKNIISDTVVQKKERQRLGFY